MHVAIIMDGNGRWACERGLPRSAGHRAGADVVRKIVEAAAAEHVDVLTLYAFSSDNWRRPAPEVNALMRLLRRYLDRETGECLANGVRVNVIGRRDRLGPELEEAIERAERRTASCRRLLLRLAVDYSARESILMAAGALAGAPADRSAFEQRLREVTHSAEDVSAVDLLIRTGGEQRLSDFLLWECAYAELEFSSTYWPDYTEREFRAALVEFRRRERRFGALSPPSRPRALAV